MTTEQWEFINAELSAQKVLLFALADVCDKALLRVAFMRAREVAETAWLHTPLSEEALTLKRRKLDEIASVIWDE